MKSIELTGVNRLGWLLIVAAAFHPVGTALSATDPTLNVSLTRTNQSVILSWGGVSVVPYQVEASSTLTGWTNISPVMTRQRLVHDFCSRPKSRFFPG